MINALIEKMTWKTVLVLGVILGLFMVIVLPNENRLLQSIIGSNESPDTSLFYTARALLAMAENYGETGRQYYFISRLRFDVAFPIIYGLFFVSMMIMLFRDTRYVRVFTWLPLLAIIFDLLENTAVSIVFLYYPNTVFLLPHLAGFFTLFKWITLMLSVLLILIGLILYVHKKKSRLI